MRDSLPLAVYRLPVPARSGGADHRGPREPVQQPERLSRRSISTATSRPRTRNRSLHGIQARLDMPATGSYAVPVNPRHALLSGTSSAWHSGHGPRVGTSGARLADWSLPPTPSTRLRGRRRSTRIRRCGATTAESQGRGARINAAPDPRPVRRIRCRRARPARSLSDPAAAATRPA